MSTARHHILGRKKKHGSIVIKAVRIRHIMQGRNIKISRNIEGEISANVKLKFLPMAQPSAVDQVYIDGVNARLEMIAFSIAAQLESMTLEEIERRTNTYTPQQATTEGLLGE